MFVMGSSLVPHTFARIRSRLNKRPGADMSNSKRASSRAVSFRTCPARLAFMVRVSSTRSASDQLFSRQWLLAGPPARQRLDACQQFFELKRLHRIVVRPEPQPGNPILQAS